MPCPSAEAETVDQITLGAFQALGRVFHLHRQAMQRRLSSPRAHHGEMITMHLLARSDGMSQSELADTLYLSRPRITSILQALEKAGSVRRQSDPDDHRVTRVFLTEEGRRRDLENRVAFEEYLAGTVGRLDTGDKQELTRLLDEISGYIAAMIGNGPSGNGPSGDGPSGDGPGEGGSRDNGSPEASDNRKGS